MSNQNAVRYGCTMLVGTDKLGIIKPIDDGYYRVPVGAYNAYNNMGMFYDLNSAMQQFQEGSPLMRQLRKGVLHGEWTHPEQGSMSDQEYIQRIRKVDSRCESHHIRKIELIPNQKDEKGRPITLVVVELKPSGPYGPALEAKLKNRHENVYFSVRSLTMDDRIRGIKYTREIVTWDYVNEGGIYSANKFNSPGLEQFNEVDVTQDTLIKLASEQAGRLELGLEDNSVNYSELLTDLGWGISKPEHRIATPNYINW